MIDSAAIVDYVDGTFCVSATRPLVTNTTSWSMYNVEASLNSETGLRPELVSFDVECFPTAYSHVAK